MSALPIYTTTWTTPITAIPGLDTSYYMQLKLKRFAINIVSHIRAYIFVVIILITLDPIVSDHSYHPLIYHITNVTTLLPQLSSTDANTYQIENLVNGRNYRCNINHLKYFCCGKETTNPLCVAAKDVEEFIVDRIETHMKDDDGIFSASCIGKVTHGNL